MTINSDYTLQVHKLAICGILIRVSMLHAGLLGDQSVNNHLSVVSRFALTAWN